MLAARRAMLRCSLVTVAWLSDPRITRCVTSALLRTFACSCAGRDCVISCCSAAPAVEHTARAKALLSIQSWWCAPGGLAGQPESLLSSLSQHDTHAQDLTQGLGAVGGQQYAGKHIAGQLRQARGGLVQIHQAMVSLAQLLLTGFTACLPRSLPCLPWAQTKSVSVCTNTICSACLGVRREDIVYRGQDVVQSPS